MKNKIHVSILLPVLCAFLILTELVSFNVAPALADSSVSANTPEKSLFDNSVPDNSVEINPADTGMPLNKLDFLTDPDSLPVTEDDPAIDGTYEKGYDPEYYRMLPFQMAAMERMLRGNKMLSSLQPGSSWNYGFQNGVTEFRAPQDGVYKLEAWGAQGGNENGTYGGAGGYAYGYTKLKKGEAVYLCVGGVGSDQYGGYNGGGNGEHGKWDGGWLITSGGGGGCTSLTRTNRGTLENFDRFRNEVLLVAAGGGGSQRCGASQFFDYRIRDSIGCAGGGLSTAGYDALLLISVDRKDQPSHHGTPIEVNQTTGYAFGRGESTDRFNGAGGGGWYGGFGKANGDFIQCGGGGSSYIDGVPAFSFGTSQYTNGTVAGANGGNGSARVTFIAYLTTAARISEPSVRKIEGQMADVQVSVKGTQGYEWQKQSAERAELLQDDKWEKVETDGEHFRVDDTLSELSGTVTLHIKTQTQDHRNWYRLKAAGNGSQAVSEPAQLLVTPLEMDYLICEAKEKQFEAGSTIPMEQFTVKAVYNNPEVSKEISEDPELAKQLRFVLPGEELSEKLFCNHVTKEQEVKIRLLNEDITRDAQTTLEIQDTSAPKLQDVKTEKIIFVPKQQEKTIRIFCKAEDKSDGKLYYWVTDQSGRSRTAEQTENIISASFQQNEVIIVHVRDESGNESSMELPVNFIDTEPPVIRSVDQIPGTDWYDGEAIVTVTAEDKMSGLAPLAYSFDGGKNWQSSNRITLKDSAELSILVRDCAGQISSVKYQIERLRHGHAQETTQATEATAPTDQKDRENTEKADRLHKIAVLRPVFEKEETVTVEQPLLPRPRQLLSPAEANTSEQKIQILTKQKKDAMTPFQKGAAAAGAACGSAGISWFGFLIFFRKCQVFQLTGEIQEENFLCSKIIFRRKNAFLILFHGKTLKAGRYKIYVSRHFQKKNAGKRFVISCHSMEYETRIQNEMFFEIQ